MLFIHSTNLYSELGARQPFQLWGYKDKQSYSLMVGAVNKINEPKETNCNKKQQVLWRRQKWAETEKNQGWPPLVRQSRSNVPERWCLSRDHAQEDMKPSWGLWEEGHVSRGSSLPELWGQKRLGISEELKEVKHGRAWWCRRRKRWGWGTRGGGSYMRPCEPGKNQKFFFRVWGQA